MRCCDSSGKVTIPRRRSLMRSGSRDRRYPGVWLPSESAGRPFEPFEAEMVGRSRSRLIQDRRRKREGKRDDRSLSARLGA